MKIVIIFLVVSGVALAGEYPSFVDYVHNFNKTYTDQQYEYREQIYKERIASWKSVTTYVCHVNNMTDWTEAQIKALSKLEQPAEKVSSGNLVRSSRVGQTSTSLDWRDKDAVTIPKNQGSCGSCWSFASAAYAQSKLIIEGKYNKDNIDLSEQYIFECTSKSDCLGGYMQYAMQTARQVPEDKQYPYNPYSSYFGICRASGIRVGYQTYNYYDVSDEDIITLLQAGPVGASVSSQSWESYGSGVFQCSPLCQLDHAILIIGYTSDYWIIKNQWGTDWGQGGYMRLTRDRTLNKSCLIGSSVHIMFQRLATLTISAIGFLLIVTF